MKNQHLSVLKAILLREMEGGMCNECGGAMYEGMCTECGYMEEDPNAKYFPADMPDPNDPDYEEKKMAWREKQMSVWNQRTQPYSDEFDSAMAARKASIPSKFGISEKKKLSGGQHKIASAAPPEDEITAADFKALKAKKRAMKENHDGQDHEVSMANNSLDSILWAANELKKYLGDQERDIPAWIQDHITNAENYILQAAKNFHEYGEEESEDEYGDDTFGYGQEEPQETGDSKMSLASLMEAKKKPSAGLSKKQKSAIAKKARKGGDVGKKGKGFEKVEKAAKKSGADNPKAVAAAAMWKGAAKRARK